MKGSAGTGKTTLISLLVNNLERIGLKAQLLAPTGRAAKVMSTYSARPATTIHRKIYSFRRSGDGSFIQLAPNFHQNTLFIIDEASMIADTGGEGPFQGRNLLDDIIQFVYSGQGCKLLFSGDMAQLPPVGYPLSPALDEEYLSVTFNVVPESFTLNEVVRQAADSGILLNAELLRKRIEAEDASLPLFTAPPMPDFVRMSGNELPELLNSRCNSGELEETVMLTRSNKMANVYNGQIRARILYRENELDAGDYLMIVRNNYFWLPKDSPAGFLANGDIVQVTRIRKIEEVFSMRFADVNVKLSDAPEEKDLDLKIILDALDAPGPSLTKENMQKLYEEIMLDYPDLHTKAERYAELRKNPWFNALQVKFPYALTCHKTQGGQWEHVIVDGSYLNSEMIDKEFLRWLYTAITRASKRVYLVNFADEFYG